MLFFSRLVNQFVWFLSGHVLERKDLIGTTQCVTPKKDMSNLDPEVLSKLHSLGTDDEEFIFDDDILKIIRFLMEYLINTDDCAQVKPTYDTLRDALLIAKDDGYDVEEAPEMIC